jgi:hypothetical protein
LTGAAADIEAARPSLVRLGVNPLLVGASAGSIGSDRALAGCAIVVRSLTAMA